MKAFNILRYLRQYSILILLITLMGAFGVYSFGASRQTYTASAVIQYTNDGASYGYTPNGEPLDAEEIYCTEVIARTIETLKLSDLPDALRSSCYVEEVIPEDQKTVNQALLDQGEMPEYRADTYRVCFVANSKKSAEFARDVLDVIISNYCEYYSEKYIEQQLLPNGTVDLMSREYDYLDTVTLLENIMTQMVDYLQQKKWDYPDFRSSATGYSFSDLYDIYRYMYDYELPRLYAMVLSQAQSRDVELLVKRLTSELESYELSLANRQKQLTDLEQLMAVFTERNKEMMDYHYHDQTATAQTEYILKDVEYRGDGANQETTYDALLLEYVDLKIACEHDRIAMAHDQYMLDVFKNGTAQGNAVSDEALQTAFDACIRELNRYFELLDSASRELNSTLSADYLKMLSTVQVRSSVNVKLYMLLAIVLFAILGCGGAVILGRGSDFVEYLLYVDKLVNLPNRNRCDLFINERSHQLLPESYSCLYIVLDSLYTYSGDGSRETGDAIMKDFASILESVSRAYGFVGYNGAGQFIAFFADCSQDKAKAIVAVLLRKVEEYNVSHPDRTMRCSLGVATSTEDNVYEIRDLLRLAIQRNRQKREENRGE